MKPHLLLYLAASAAAGHKETDGDKVPCLNLNAKADPPFPPPPPPPPPSTSQPNPKSTSFPCNLAAPLKTAPPECKPPGIICQSDEQWCFEDPGAKDPQAWRDTPVFKPLGTRCEGIDYKALGCE